MFRGMTLKKKKISLYPLQLITKHHHSFRVVRRVWRFWNHPWPYKQTINLTNVVRQPMISPGRPKGVSLSLTSETWWLCKNLSRVLFPTSALQKRKQHYQCLSMTGNRPTFRKHSASLLSLTTRNSNGGLHAVSEGNWFLGEQSWKVDATGQVYAKG